jgi:hypothetical protein
MTARLRSWTHRHERVALLLVACGCLSTGGGGGCGANAALGQGTFSYACPGPDPANPSTPNPDAICASTAFATLGSLPDVAVGAPFSLQFSPSSGEAPRPAIASLAVSTPDGWSLTQPGWLGFLAWSGSDVVDFTHVHAQAIASLRLEPDLTTTPVATGFVADLSVTPLGGDGGVLGGAIACSFTTSDPKVLSVKSLSGRAARVGAVAAGEATIAASCMGAATQITVQVAVPVDGSGAAADDAGGDASEDQSAEAGADANASGNAGADVDAEAGGGG